MKNTALIAGVITDATQGNILNQLKKVKNLGADIVEMRVDLFSATTVEIIEIFRKTYNERNRLGEQIIPLIVTIRRKQEGGNFLGNEEDRLWLYRTIMTTLRKGDMIDIELNATKIRDEVIEKAKEKGLKVIVSHHNFEKTLPCPELEEIISEEIKAGADIAKVAFKANDIEDAYILQELLKRCKNKEKPVPVIVLPMGEKWKTVRLLVPFITDNYINYGAIEDTSAPGQPSAEELRNALNLVNSII